MAIYYIVNETEYVHCSLSNGGYTTGLSFISLESSSEEKHKFNYDA